MHEAVIRFLLFTDSSHWFLLIHYSGRLYELMLSMVNDDASWLLPATIPVLHYWNGVGTTVLVPWYYSTETANFFHVHANFAKKSASLSSCVTWLFFLLYMPTILMLRWEFQCCVQSFVKWGSFESCYVFRTIIGCRTNPCNYIERLNRKNLFFITAKKAFDERKCTARHQWNVHANQNCFFSSPSRFHLTAAAYWIQNTNTF